MVGEPLEVYHHSACRGANRGLGLIVECAVRLGEENRLVPDFSLINGNRWE